jgi:hypothetical protein
MKVAQGNWYMGRTWQSTTTTYQLWGNFPIMFVYESMSPSCFCSRKTLSQREKPGRAATNVITSPTVTFEANSSHDRLRIIISQNAGLFADRNQFELDY